jgi:hypothetical protein
LRLHRDQPIRRVGRNLETDLKTRPLPTTIDDADRHYFGSSPICRDCRHRIGAGYLACAAFPDRIPREIWNGQRDHNSPYPGDHGIRFAPLTDDDRERNRQLADEAAVRLEKLAERVRAQREAVGAPER